MKKTISLLLAALLALSAITVSMASCERNNPADTTADDTPKELTPKEIYEAAVKKFDEANNYAVTYNHSNRLREGKGKLWETYLYEDVTEHRDGDNVHCNISQNGQKTELSHIDGVMYMTQSGVKAKATMTVDEFVAYFQYERPDVVEKLSDSAYEKMTVAQEGDITVMRFDLSDAEMRSMAGDLRNFLQLGAASDSAKFKYGTYTVRFNQEGYIIQTEWDFDMTVVHAQKMYECNARAKANISYSAAPLTPPHGGGNYVDITGQLG